MNNLDVIIEKRKQILKKIEELEREKEVINNELIRVFESNENIKIWKNSLIDSSDWFHVKDYIDFKTFWCSNFNEKYANNEKFVYKIIDNKTYFKPKEIKNYE